MCIKSLRNVNENIKENYIELYIFHSAHFGNIVTMQSNKMHTFRYNYNNVLIYVNLYVFRATLVYHQGLYGCIKKSLDRIIISSI
jgi:hypothetical protein